MIFHFAGPAARRRVMIFISRGRPAPKTGMIFISAAAWAQPGQRPPCSPRVAPGCGLATAGGAHEETGMISFRPRQIKIM